MLSWKNASKGDLIRLATIEIILKKRKHLIENLFHPFEASLRSSPECVSRGLSLGEKILVNLVMDVWQNGNETRVSDLLSLDQENFENAIEAIKMLRYL